MSRMSAAFIALLFSGSPSLLLAVDRYVSKEGSNANPGTLAQPYLTIQHAINQSAPGDVVHVRGITASNAQAVYGERLIITGLSGSAAQPITVRNHAADPMLPALDGTSITPAGMTGMIQITGQSHWIFIGLEVRNYKTTSASAIPCGILISGACQNIRLQNLKVHDIWQSSTGTGDGFGIAAYGDAAAPIDGLVIDGCEVHSLRTGSSESVVLNGNVTNFQVTGNIVRDCNNIGVDFIGYEGTNPNPALDRARNGVCSGNTVFNIDSRYNPAYGGNFTTGGGDASAAGVYVDGGSGIVIERNHIFGCNFGVELASEDPAGFTDHITVRNNLLHRNHVAGLIMGGYDRLRGATRFCTVTNNTFYENDTLATYTGQIALQFYVSDCAFKNNLVWANATTKQMVIHYPGDNQATAAQKEIGANMVFDYNRYFCPAGGPLNLEFGLFKNGLQRSFITFNGWRTNVNGLLADANGSYGNPGFAIATPAAAPASPTAAQLTETMSQFLLAAASAAINAGEPSPPFVAGTSPVEKDLFGQSRIASSRVDIGADEHMTAWQAWRDQYFALPDGGANANAADDFDLDGADNLLEYSQGMNPAVSDLHLLPFAVRQTAGSCRFTYRKAAPELIYTARKSSDLSTWTDVTSGEVSAGGGLFYRDSPLDSPQLFFLLQVTQP